MEKVKEKSAEKIWAGFQEAQKLTDKQLEMFKKYEALLSEWNKTVNLTAITNLGGIVRQHFEDSLELRKFTDLNQIKNIADIGPGAGFPIIPLKILYPHLNVLLIEVGKKRHKFLAALAETLQLENIEICDMDWRTFLRTTQFDIDLFVTRATINELELSRMFKPASSYKNSTLVYWVSEEWQPHERAEKFVKETKEYKLGIKNRKLAFMELPKE